MELIDVNVPKGAFTIAPVGDIQYGSQGCSESLLRKHIQHGIEEGWRFIGMGDYLDPMSPSNRALLKRARADLYESTVDLLDDAVHEKVRQLADGPLAGSSGQWDGLIHGDHGWDFADGQPADALLAAKLKGKYLGDSSIITYRAKGVEQPLRVFVTHGRGASISATGKTLHLERMLNAFDVDIVLMGHSHLKYAFPAERIAVVEGRHGPRLFARQKVCGITGSFLKGYEEGTRSAGWAAGSYVERAALRPVPIGAFTIQATPEKHEWGYEWALKIIL